MRIWLAFVLAAASASALAQDAAALQAGALAATCAACHGTLGHAVEGSTVPPLAGRQADVIDALMKAFRSGTRAGTVMPQLAKGYSDAQIAALARVFAAEKP